MTLGGTSSTRTYNTHGEPLSEVTSLPGSAAYSETYTRDALGRIETKTETAPSGAATTFAYAYDPAGRLSGVTKNGDPYRSYTYDANGNRTSVTRQTSSGPVTETTTFDAQDKQTSSGDFDLTYNANGELASKTNRTTGDSQTYAYSSMGVLKSVTPSGGSTRAYKYDAAGNRVETRESGQPVQRLIYAPGLLGPVAELAGPGREETRFIYASRMNVPDYMVRAGRTYRFVTDQLGSVRFVVDTVTGEVAQEITYDPFGEVISDSEPGFQPFGFAGGLYDSATGLTHFGAREYDARIGRWTSSDPISFSAEDPNLYEYATSDPLNFIDPEGLFRIGPFDSSASWDYFKNYMAGVYHGATLGLADSLVGIDPECMGTGFGFGSFMGTLIPIERGIWLAQEVRAGREYAIGKNARIAPWGNRGPGRVGKPHYHRRVPDPSRPGAGKPNQGMGRHRPWENRESDSGFRDRF